VHRLRFASRFKITLALGISLVTSGCATYGIIDNSSQTSSDGQQNYSMLDYNSGHKGRDDVTVIMSFSGGGSRAAALSYGVLQALRDTPLELEGQQHSLLSEVDMISSVSGGSFTAAYYGLHGERIFSDFEDDFLRRDYVTEWVYGVLSPLLWFSNRGRTDIATGIYEQRLFRGATFADLQQRQDAPFIVINASDLGAGIRFSFIQEYFDLLCSNIADYPIARAVTASSAVPVMLNPVVLKNHKGCLNPIQNYLRELNEEDIAEAKLSPHLHDTITAMRSYAAKDERQYIHLVDGGITDNLGLMAFYEMVEIGGGIEKFLTRLGAQPSKHLVVISVNASTKPQYDIEQSNKIPDIEPTIGAVTDTQLHRYNAATISLMRRTIDRWSHELSSSGQQVKPYFIEISFDGVQQEQRRGFINQIPTSLSLNKEQADTLIHVGSELLRYDPVFKQLLEDLQQTSSNQD